MPDFLENKIDIGGREIPVVALAAGAGVILALVVILTRGKKPVVAATAGQGTPTTQQVETAGAASNLSADLMAQIANAQAGFDASLGQIRSDFTGEITGQVSGLRGEFASGLAGLQSQMGGQYANLQSVIQRQQAETQAALQSQSAQIAQAGEATSNKLTALTSRVAAVEAQEKVTRRGVFNLATWLSRWNSGWLATFNPQQQQAAGGEFTANVSVPLQAFTGNYQGA